MLPHNLLDPLGLLVLLPEEDAVVSAVALAAEPVLQAEDAAVQQEDLEVVVVSAAAMPKARKTGK